LTEAHAFKRAFGSKSCRELMLSNPVTLEFSTPLKEAWNLLQKQNPKVLYVLDRAKRVAGIVTEIGLCGAQ